MNWPAAFLLDMLRVSETIFACKRSFFLTVSRSLTRSTSDGRSVAIVSMLAPAAAVAWHPFRHGLARNTISYVSVTPIVHQAKHQVRLHDGNVLEVEARTAQALIAGRGLVPGPQSIAYIRALNNLSSTLYKRRRAQGRAAIQPMLLPPFQPHTHGFKYVFGMMFAIVIVFFAFLTAKMAEPTKAAPGVFLPSPMPIFTLPEPEPVLFLPGPPLCANSTESIFDHPWAWINTISCGIATIWADLNARPSYEPL